jgi:hypothetical protein
LNDDPAYHQINQELTKKLKFSKLEREKAQYLKQSILNEQESNMKHFSNQNIC